MEIFRIYLEESKELAVRRVDILCAFQKIHNIYLSRNFTKGENNS